MIFIYYDLRYLFSMICNFIVWLEFPLTCSVVVKMAVEVTVKVMTIEVVTVVVISR